MAYILDGAVILIFLVAIWLGYRRGFVKSLIQLVGCVAAALIASTCSAPLASGIFDVFFAEKLEQSVAAKIGETDEASVREALDGLLDELPGPVANTLKLYGLDTPESIVGKLDGAFGGSAEKIGQAVVSTVVKPVAVSLLRMLCFSILFIALMVLVSILASVINRVFSLPVLRTVNGLLGAVAGAVQGALIVLVAVMLVTLTTMVSDDTGALNRKAVNDTVIVRTVEKWNPANGALEALFEK